MKLKIIITSLILFCLNFSSVTGQIKNLINLKPGDKVPHTIIPNIINYKNSSATLSDFEGKLLIIDFWATWCSPCRYMLPKMDSLQRVFKDKIQFLPVTYESKEVVANFFSKLKRDKNIETDFPEVTNDTTLIKIFPHNIYPHYVWIDKDGVVLATTGMDEVNAKNISAYLEDKKPALIEKVDQSRLDYEKKATPLLEFVANNKYNIELNPTLESYAIFSKYIRGLGGGGMWLENEREPTKKWRWTSVNNSMTQIFKFSYGEHRRFIHPTQVIVDVKDSIKFDNEGSGLTAKEWIPKYTFCVEVSVPPELHSKRWEILRTNISNYFNKYQATIENQVKDCYVLVRTKNSDKLKTIGGEPRTGMDDKYNYKSQNVLLGWFVTTFNHKYFVNKPYCLVDQTNYPSGVDLELEGDLSDIDIVNKSLAKYDLKIELKKAEVEVLVIRDK